MVNIHKEKSAGPRYQIGKFGLNFNTVPITRARKSEKIPQRTNLFPGWDLKISQKIYIVSSPIPIARIVG
jgi:hypothetical protein